MEALGVRSLGIASVVALFTGLVMATQFAYGLQKFGGMEYTGRIIGLSFSRELAPSLTAVVVGARIGSGITAEIGSMAVTEQIDAMEVSATNPYKFLVVTRVLATTFMIPVLVMYTDFVALMGAFINVNANELVSISTFFAQVFSSVTFLDIFSSIIKSLFFGFTIGMVGCYKGYNSSKGTEGVGRAANAAVVVSMFLIFIEELLSLQIINLFRMK